MLQISQDSKDILSKLFIDGDAKTLSTTLSQSLLNSIDRPDDLAAISLLESAFKLTASLQAKANN